VLTSLVDSNALSAALQVVQSKLTSIEKEIQLCTAKNAASASSTSNEDVATESDGFASFMSEFAIDMQRQYADSQLRFDAAVKACDELASVDRLMLEA
jgi:hypothetical protein